MPTVFKCLRCGNCCRHEGEVRLDEGEPAAIATGLGMDVESFTNQYTRLREDRRGLSLKDLPDGTCIFLTGAPPSCQIQADKPRQCRDFPLQWKYNNLKTICPAANNVDMG